MGREKISAGGPKERHGRHPLLEERYQRKTGKNERKLEPYGDLEGEAARSRILNCNSLPSGSEKVRRGGTRKDV